MIILIDQDGPLANFEKSFLEQWRMKFPGELFVPLERRKSFYTRDDYPDELREKVVSIYSAPGFFLNLLPIDGAIKAVGQLMELGHNIIICTSPVSNYENCVLEKYQWVERYFGRDFTKKIVFTKDKTLVRGDLLIDDNPIVSGIAQPEWEHIIFDYPYNRGVVNSRRINWVNWREVLEI